jgi:hypothetical protein
MPLAFRAFYEIVGEVNFVGTLVVRRPEWPSPEDGLDPLYVAPVSDIAEASRSAASTRLLVSPDSLAKYFIRGVGYQYIELPDRRTDAPIQFDGAPFYVGDIRMTLVRYLRYALRGGGFLNFMPGSAWAPRPLDDLVFLTHDLLPT